jgi:hypothetical protein
MWTILALATLTAPSVFPDPASMAYLESLTKAVVEAARVRPNQKVPGAPADVNSTGITLLQPGGQSGYPSYWIRDFSMSLDCGYVTPEEMHGALILTAMSQNGPTERKLTSGGIIPAHAIPDHIRFDGRPVFYPGTYSYGEDQGADPWGPLPPADDHYYYVHIAYRLWMATGDAAFLKDSVNGMTLGERLQRAFDAVPTDAKTGAVACVPSNRCVGFGFDDSVYMTGAMSFATLLRYQAAVELAEMLRAARIGKPRTATWFRDEARRIASHLPALFCDPEKVGGWLRGSTGISNQADVWATLFALHLGVLSKDVAEKARQTVAEAVKNGTIEYMGAVRHVPTNLDARADSAWERSVAGLNTYQNGGYWHTPTGWLIEALWQVDKPAAKKVLASYIAHLKAGDFRKGGQAPVECLGPLNGGWTQNPCYMTSVTLPLAVLKGLGEKKGR